MVVVVVGSLESAKAQIGGHQIGPVLRSAHTPFGSEVGSRDPKPTHSALPYPRGQLTHTPVALQPRGLRSRCPRCGTSRWSCLREKARPRVLAPPASLRPPLPLPPALHRPPRTTTALGAWTPAQVRGPAQGEGPEGSRSGRGMGRGGWAWHRGLGESWGGIGGACWEGRDRGGAPRRKRPRETAQTNHRGNGRGIRRWGGTPGAGRGTRYRYHGARWAEHLEGAGHRAGPGGDAGSTRGWAGH